jgi:hypothetical protein
MKAYLGSCRRQNADLLFVAGRGLSLEHDHRAVAVGGGRKAAPTRRLDRGVDE